MTREKEIYKVTILGGIVNVALLSFKFIAGFVAGSAAMVADAVHSLSDFFTDIIVLVFVRISSKPADEGHDFGHGKYETLASTLVGLALFAVAVGILYGGAVKVAAWSRGEELPKPGMLALWAAMVSIVLKEGIYVYTARKARELNSQALLANAWHHRSDALSSVGTAVGIGGAILLGERWTVLDPIASIVVGALIVKISIGMMKNGIDELMESSLPADIEDEIFSIANSIEGVSEPHKLRTRRIGSHFAMEMHIRMDGDMSLRDAHERTTELERRIRERFGKDTYVIIHTEPKH
ncbi:MAG: cation diffusion facilitator family transporter [Bacteroidales bacterium]|nr:cation diffusion facilitator family transporter [Bacteroidales bacterium]